MLEVVAEVAVMTVVAEVAEVAEATVVAVELVRLVVRGLEQSKLDDGTISAEVAPAIEGTIVFAK